MSSNKDSNISEDDHRTRILILGIDGATFDLIEPMVKEGRLPTLSKLMKKGASGVLESTIPPVTIPAWTSMTTGMNPGKLGFFDLLQIDGYGVKPSGYCYENTNPIWKILNQYGIKTGVINLPGTYPPDEVEGFMVTGMLTPSKRSLYSFPKSLSTSLDQTVSDYEIDVPQWQYFDEGDFIKDVYKVTWKRQRAAEYLVSNMQCEFYMIVFTSSDRLQHVLWHKKDIIESFWEELDEIIGRIIDLFDEDTTVFIVSDHGFGPLEKTFYVNEWLRKNMFLKVKRKINHSALVKLGMIAEKAYLFLRERKMMRPILSFINEVVGFDRLLKYSYAYLSNMKLEERVNWKRTKAFSRVHTPHFGQIYLNKKGQMEKGSVSDEERGIITEKITKELKNLADPLSGKKFDVKTYLPENIYSGPYVNQAPDILFILDNGRCEIDAKVGDGKLFMEGAPITGWTGTHTPEGVFIARGPGIKAGFKFDKANVVDITPTILRVFGIQKQHSMDGRVIHEIFTDDSEFPLREKITIPDSTRKESYFNEEEKALIEEKLRRLGYIS